MDATAGEKIKDPHNFALELWSTGGVFALIAVVAALAVFFWRTVVYGLGQHPGADAASGQDRPESLRWEFYAGGMIGLVLGFYLALEPGQGPDSLMLAGLAAAVRSVLWFVFFALFERIRWPEPARVLALTAGIAALLLNLGVSGGISVPSVAGLMWIAVALTLAALAISPLEFPSASKLHLVLPIPVALAALMLYLSLAYEPTADGLAALRAAEARGQRLTATRAGVLACTATYLTGVAGSPDGYAAQLTAVVVVARSRRESSQFSQQLEREVIGPLVQATNIDPRNARLYVRRAYWWGVYWEWTIRSELGSDALKALKSAHTLNPQGLEGLLLLLDLRERFARASSDLAKLYHALQEDTALPTEARIQFGKQEAEARENVQRNYVLAAEALNDYLTNDPTDAPLRFRLADLLVKAGKLDSAMDEARIALQFDALSTAPPRRLTDPQRKLAQTWAGANAPP
jgi:hypothetical protein